MRFQKSPKKEGLVRWKSLQGKPMAGMDGSNGQSGLEKGRHKTSNGKE